MQFTNPVIPGFHPDPSICRVGEGYYLVTSSFEYFPGVPVFHSKNLVNWRQIGHCLTRPSQLPLEGAGVSGGIFAPTLRYHEGRFYMVTTNLTHGGHFYVTAEDPAGEWSDPVWIDAEGIDPDLFWDDDGRVYFSSTGDEQIVLQREIDLDSGRILSDAIRVNAMTGGKYPEAPHVYKKGDTYYLMMAEGGTEYGHCVTIARGPTPTGPWKPCPDNPILTHRSTDLPIQATGHADLVEDQNGNWWMACLGIRPKGLHAYHVMGRETFMAPVSWEAGWPIVGDSGRIGLEMNGHEGLPAVEVQEIATTNSFDSPELPFHWNFIGNPKEGNFSYGQGHLSLRCAEPDLNTMHGQSWLGRRQQHFAFRASARLDFNPDSEAEEAGITVFQNVQHHYEVGLTLRGGRASLVVRRTIGSLVAEVACEAVDSGSVELFVESDASSYRFGYVDAQGEVTVLAEGEARYLSTEVGGKFTGVYIALYATSSGTKSENKALYRIFEYKPQ